MNTPHRSRPLHAMAAAALAAALLPAAAWSASSDLNDARQRYQQQRADCLAGRNHQDRATCLKEAQNAWAEARRGRLDNATSPQENATRRCEVFTGSDRDLCIARVREGSVSGSVTGGGVYREHVVREVGTPVPVAPAASAAAPR